MGADKEMIDSAPNLKYIGMPGTGYGMIDNANAELLVRQTIEGDDPEVRFTPSSGGLQGEHNYDFEFRVPSRLDGRCYVKLTYFATATATKEAQTDIKVRQIYLDTADADTVIGAQ